MIGDLKYAVLVSQIFATTFKVVRVYEFFLTLCPKISGIVLNIDNIE